MIFIKQYLITLTFIVIAVWVMPANTERGTLSALCTELYKYGRLTIQYREIPTYETRETEDPEEKKKQEKELQDIRNYKGPAAKAPENFEDDRKKLEDLLKTRIQEARNNIKETLTKIAENEHIPTNTDIKALITKISTTEDVDKVLHNLTAKFSDFIEELLQEKETAACPFVYDFCSARTESTNYINFYESIFTLPSVETNNAV